MIEDAYKLNIFLNDGRMFSVERVINYDKNKDIAVLKVDGTDLPVSKLGNSEAVVNGQKILTIGNPIGMQNTISDGLVGNRERLVDGQKYIQISALISPGSSGGVLLNYKAEVIGVTTSSFVAGQNLNLAIPINVVKPYFVNTRSFTLADLFGKKVYKKITNNDGTVYEGDTIYGEPEGNGTLSYPDGSKYVGIWVNGARQGRGTFIFSDGSTVSGEWVNGKFVEDKLLPPAKVRARAISTSEIEIGWDSVNGASGYNVYYALNYEGPYYKFEDEQKWIGEYSSKLYNIEGNTTVYFKVTSLNLGKESDYSEIVSAKTQVDYRSLMYIEYVEAVDKQTVNVVYSNVIGYSKISRGYYGGTYMIRNSETEKPAGGILKTYIDSNNGNMVIVKLLSTLKRGVIYQIISVSPAVDIYGNESESGVIFDFICP